MPAGTDYLLYARRRGAVGDWGSQTMIPHEGWKRTDGAEKVDEIYHKILHATNVIAHDISAQPGHV